MLPVMVLILLLHGCLTASDEGPKFESKNFNNVLHWESDKRNISGEQVLYSVEYWRYEDPPNKISKLECQNIAALSCDLTAETPPIPNVQYIAQVFANGVPHGKTLRFTPIAETVLGQPIVSVTSTMSSLHVNVTLPSGPNGTSLADIFNKIKQPPGQPSIKPTLYKLYITEPEWAAQVSENTSSYFVIDLKKHNTEYCGYVVYRPHFKMGRPPSEKTAFCATLKGDPWVVYRWVVIAAVLLMVLIIISVAFIVRYVNGGKKQRMPKVLETILRIQDNFVQSPDVNPFICKPTVCSQSDLTIYKPTFCPQIDATIRKPAVYCPQSDNPTVYATILLVPSEGSGGYSPQNVPCPALSWDSSSSLCSSAATPVSQDTSYQSSTVYSAVGIHQPDAEAPEFLQATNGYRKDNWSLVEPRQIVASHEASPFPDLDSQDSISEGTLLLSTFRDSKGQLSFPMFKFESRSAKPGTVIPLVPKGRPLLSDLVGEGRPLTLLSLNSVEECELSDSDFDQSTLNTPSQVSYNSQYFPFKLSLPAPSTEEDQTSQMGHVTFESGYKQNWMAASPLGIG